MRFSQGPYISHLLLCETRDRLDGICTDNVDTCPSNIGKEFDTPTSCRRTHFACSECRGMFKDLEGFTKDVCPCMMYISQDEVLVRLDEVISTLEKEL